MNSTPLGPEPETERWFQEDQEDQAGRTTVRLPRLARGRWLGWLAWRRGGGAWFRRPRPRRLRDRPSWLRGWRLAAGAVLLTFALPLLLLLLPVPVLDGPLARVVTSRIARQITCPGAPGGPLEVRIKGGRLVPQLLRGRLSEIDLRLPDASVGGVEHATLTATLRDASQPKTGVAHIGSVNAAITVGFANLPSIPDTPHPTFGRSTDGSLTIRVIPSAESTKNVKTTLLAKLELRGETVNVVPQRLLVFGREVPAKQAESQTGGVRTQTLPHLPYGLTYRSVTPGVDGLHIELGGVMTTPFSDLPTTVGGNSVSYSGGGGLLGISTSKQLPLLGNIPLTIYTAPRLDGDTVTLVPQSVEIFGRNRPPRDPIAALVLSQIDQSELTRTLPALPSGLRYQSVGVDSSGIHAVIDGATVKPYSELPATIDGRPATYGVTGDLLAVTTTGTATDRPVSVVLHTKPTITGTTLDLRPDQIEMFGVMFPARDVLATLKVQSTRYRLRSLPPHLVYQGVEVLTGGLRITMNGKDVTLRRGELGNASCH